MTRVSNKANFDDRTLNSVQKIIIKKENIGLEEYQHQKYQYSLFNNNAQLDKFYEDLSKMKDRLGRGAPNMQQVIHMDMKRANTNKVYERKLSQELTGPRGLNWQYKQELQRLQNDEREAERDLMRLKRDHEKFSSSSPRGRCSTSHQNRNLSQIQTPRSSVQTDTSSITQVSQNTKPSSGRPYSINTNRMTNDWFSPINQKQLSINRTSLSSETPPWIGKKTDEHHSYLLQQHADSINQQKREIERKLKQFLH